MVDIHSHILPGLDDGSPDLETSVGMARLAAEHGTTDIVASPHCDFQHSFDPAVVEAGIEELNQACAGALRIHYGCDFHLHYENVQDAVAHPAKYAVNHKRYLLVELSDLLAIRGTEEALRQLVAARLFVIITHPERNGILRRQLGVLASWVEEGIFLQVTAQSLFGVFGRNAKSCAVELLRRGLVHFVASDGHDLRRRPPRLDQAFEWVSKELGEATATRLFVEHPAAVLSGEPISAGRLPVNPARRHWWSFWR
jgi:protein-tyrosine phosphatase